MEVLFYSKAAKLSLSPESKWIKVFLDENDKEEEFEIGDNSFQDTNLVCGRAEIFVSDAYTNVHSTLETIIVNDVEPLTVKYQSDVVLVCSLEFFLAAIKNTKKRRNGTPDIGNRRKRLIILCSYWRR